MELNNFEGALRFSQNNSHKCSLRLLQLIVKIHVRNPRSKCIRLGEASYFSHFKFTFCYWKLNTKSNHTSVTQVYRLLTERSPSLLNSTLLHYLFFFFRLCALSHLYLFACLHIGIHFFALMTFCTWLCTYYHRESPQWVQIPSEIAFLFLCVFMRFLEIFYTIVSKQSLGGACILFSLSQSQCFCNVYPVALHRTRR